MNGHIFRVSRNRCVLSVISNKNSVLTQGLYGLSIWIRGKGAAHMKCYGLISITFILEI